MRFVNLKQALNYISMNIREEEANDLQLLSYMLSAVRQLNLSQFHEYKVELIGIENHKAKLDSEIRKINLVTYACESLDEGDLTNVCNSLVPTEDTSEDCLPCGSGKSSSDICRHTLYQQIWLDSNTYNNKFFPLKYIGNVSSDYLLNDKSPNRYCDCQETFSIDTELNITTSFKNGVISVDYLAETKNIDGDFMIPDNERIKLALAKWAEYMHWENRLNIHEDGAFRIVQKRQADAEIAMKRAKGSQLLRNMNSDEIKDVIKGEGMRQIRAPFRFMEESRFRRNVR